MTEEIIIDKEEFWDMFEQHPINAVEGLFGKIEMIVNLLKRLEQENKELKEKFEQYKTSKQKSYETLQKRLNDIEWENKELKEKIKKYSAINEQDTKDYAILRNALLEIRKKLCYGRTFYEGYFDSENLSRTDKVIKKINEVLK